MNESVSVSIGMLRSTLLLCCLSSAVQAQHAPQDVRATAADGAHVVLQWSLPGRYATSYELQRATGDGAFATIGKAIRAAALTVADTTAAVSSVYRYRLLARVAPADSEYSNVVAVTTSAREERRQWPPAAYLRPAVYGRVLDSLTGLPLPSLRFFIRDQIGVYASDSRGRYLFFDVRPGTHEVAFFCPTKRAWWGHVFATRSIAVTAQTDSALDFHVVLRDCEEPPLRTWSGEFRGHYRGGFEASDFTPCAAFENLKGTAYEGSRRTSAWVSFSEAARAQFRPTGGSADDPDNPGAFVRWRATVTGPGSYGHLGVAMYDMLVTDILEMRAATPTDCR